MARLILTILGPWGKLPDFTTPFALRWSPADRKAAEQLVEVARRAEHVEDETVSAIRKHQGIVEAEVRWEKPGDREMAVAAARLLREAFKQGAVGALVDTSLKAFLPGSLDEVEIDDLHTLFHLFVEVLGDAQEWSTEGMQCFDLPEVVTPYATPDQSTAAQVATFTLAARMVCDRFRPSAGTVVRASESAPFFTCKLRPSELAPPGEARPPEQAGEQAEAEEDPFVNPRGAWVLSLR